MADRLQVQWRERDACGVGVSWQLLHVSSHAPVGAALCMRASWNAASYTFSCTATMEHTILPAIAGTIDAIYSAHGRQMVRWLLACLLPLMRSSSGLDARGGDLAERLKTDVRQSEHIACWSPQSQLACQACHGLQKTKLV